MRTLRALAVLTVVLTAACSDSGPAPRQVHTSRNVEYRSLKHAARDADAVVEIAVDQAGVVESVGAVPFTVTSARVAEVMKGRFDGDVIRLRQLGSSQGGGLVPEGELLEAGKRYVAIVVPFTFADFQPTGQHVVVGAWQGLYRVEGDELVATDKVRTALPRRLTKRSFVAAISEP
ncbi:MAG TPA: hypothetical protein VHF47_06700 [Acidimicrobiales bacterium]|nr:hypothetical protein [Acidimicrobiales bacterium]